MGESESPSSPSSDRRQWQRIFKTIVEMMQSQQSQIETLADDRKFLEDYIHIQKKFWASRAGLLESQISQMKKEEEMGRRVFASKSNLMEGSTKREALLYKKQLELAESDLEDFRVCMETVSAEILELKERIKCRESDKGKTGISDSKTVIDSKEQEQCIAALEREIRKLKHDHRKLSSKKEVEISALLAEKDFVWNQFKKTDNDYTAFLKTNRIEVEQANETIEMLQHNLEKLQSSANDKDETIANLEAERSRLQLDIRRCTKEAEQRNEKIEKLRVNVQELRSSVKEKDVMIANLRSDLAKFDMNLIKCTNVESRFSKDLDSHRSSRNASVTRTGSHPRRGSVRLNLETAINNTRRKRKCVNENSSGSRASGKVNGLERCSTRLQRRTISPLQTPRLFSANLKVPKVKNLPPASV